VRNDFDGEGLPGFTGTPVYGEAYNTPGAENEIVPEPPLVLGACGDPATFIHAVQGTGFVSPLAGESVVVEGIVVGDFQATGYSGFFLQEEDADADADVLSSEGVFVYDPAVYTDVAEGDVVRVLGPVSEYNELTEITISEAVLCTPAGSATPQEVNLPVTAVSDLERFEGMAVVFPQELYISEYFNFDRFGEIVLTTERQFQPTAIYSPGSSAASELLDLNLRSRIMIDDGRTAQNPDPAIHPDGSVFTLANRFRGGDIVDDFSGVMHYSFGEYRIQPTGWGDYIQANPRQEDVPDVGGEVEVAAFNVLNYFTTIDTGAWICGPSGDLECRGADDANELSRQRTKILAALSEIDADVVGLIEIENDADESVADLVQGLNDIFGAGTYDYISTGFIGTDAIKQALIYKPESVTPIGSFAVLDTDAFVDPNNTGSPKNRPALAQTFESNLDGAKITVVVNHLKSKGSGCGAGDDDPEQGSCNLTRTLAAGVLMDWLAGDPTGSGDEDFLIIGDLNAYDHEDPIMAFEAGGYVDLLGAYQGEYAYTYVFDGQLGYLDYGMANAALVDQVTGANTWHINADEPDILDYDTTFKQDAQDALFEPNAFRSSDHDPVLVGLDLNAAPVCTDAYPSVDLLWPVNHKFVPVEVLGVTDADGDPITITIDSIFQDEVVDDGGDGNTAPDGQGVGTSVAEVRAERAADGNGRFYHISFTADDGRGASCSGVVLVSVPHDQGKKAEEPMDEGPLYDSTEVSELDMESLTVDETTVGATEEPQGDTTSEPTGETADEPNAAVTPEAPETSNGNDEEDN
jgi:predicted extracellular nuclease